MAPTWPTRRRSGSMLALEVPSLRLAPKAARRSSRATRYARSATRPQEGLAQEALSQEALSRKALPATSSPLPGPRPPARSSGKGDHSTSGSGPRRPACGQGRHPACWPWMATNPAGPRTVSLAPSPFGSALVRGASRRAAGGRHRNLPGLVGPATPGPHRRSRLWPPRCQRAPAQRRRNSQETRLTMAQALLLS